jgi:hypothetical protein
MLQSVIDFVNANPAIMVGAMCLVGAAFVVVYAIEGKNRRKMLDRIRQLKEAVETKERLIVHKDAEIKKLKTELFAARCDKKFADEKLNKRIHQLETDKKQLTKWGSEK